MFRKLAIAALTAWASLLETVADAIAATLPPPAADSPRLRVVASGRLCLACTGRASPGRTRAASSCLCQEQRISLAISSRAPQSRSGPRPP
jgi:hypothetical protein